jgi:hypothetical protein
VIEGTVLSAVWESDMAVSHTRLGRGMAVLARSCYDVLTGASSLETPKESWTCPVHPMGAAGAKVNAILIRGRPISPARPWLSSVLYSVFTAVLHTCLMGSR